MENENKTKKHNIFKSMLIAIVALTAIIGTAAVVLPLFKLPGWPFTFFLFYFLTIVGMKKEKLLTSAIGGFMGMTICFTPTLVGFITGNEGIGWIVFFVFLIAVVTITIDGRVKAVDHLCMLMITVLLPPGLHLDLSAETYFPALVTYAITVALFTIVLWIFSNMAKKKEVSGSV